MLSTSQLARSVSELRLPFGAHVPVKGSWEAPASVAKEEAAPSRKQTSVSRVAPPTAGWSRRYMCAWLLPLRRPRESCSLRLLMPPEKATVAHAVSELTR